MSTSFWHHAWLDGVNSLIESAENIDINQDLEAIVAKYVNEFGQWNFEAFTQFLPQDIINKIRVVPTPYPSDGRDKIRWGLTSNGLFSVKSAYSSRNCFNYEPNGV